MKWLKRILVGILVLVVVAYAGVCVWLRASESRIAFTRWMRTSRRLPRSR